MVKIRLRRAGKKKLPVYKIVVADSRASRTGKFIQVIGTYDPNVHPMVITVDESRLFSWMKKGAQLTDTVRSLFRRKGLMLKWSLMRKGADEATIAAEFEKWQTAQTEKLSREAERKERRRVARKKKSATEPAAAPAPAAPAAEPAPAS